MLSLFGLGFVLGIRHALEADHAAAVASLSFNSRSISHTLRQGLAWGVGHTVTLLIFSSIVLLLGLAIPGRFAQGLEFFVGLMLLGLGIDVLRKIWTRGWHLHVHDHAHHRPHLHIHAHQKQNGQEPVTTHDHAHPQGFPYRALFVGLMHGMAGSAALIILTLQTVISPMEAMMYILLFGLGSTLGMGLFSLVMAIPFWYTARSLTHWHHGMQICIGFLTIFLGLYVIYHHADWLLS
jgi:hypothetical protein